MFKSRYLFPDLFGRSPIAPIQEHIKIAYECSAELLPYIDAVILKDWEQAKAISQRIFDLEDKADDLKKQIRVHLPTSLFLPVSRTDLLELLRMQDTIANLAKDITGLILGRQTEIPEAISSALRANLVRSVEAAELACQVLAELDELVVTGFSRREVEIVEKLVVDLDNVEHETDLLGIDLRLQLFAIEASLNPINVVFLYKIIEWIGDIADQSQAVGNRMLYLIAR
ncbi:MAG: TIGR00153 family protein [Gammaproteobacteria bacterium]|nr:TIGR00153 family protein [Gammaproteobacteria bacterium]